MTSRPEALEFRDAITGDAARVAALVVEGFATYRIRSARLVGADARGRA